MKKLLAIIVLGLLWNSVGLATNKTMEELLSDNYKITKEELIKFDRHAHKIFTLKKRNSVIVCSVKISRLLGIRNYSKCMTP
jgi:hypothetical protein